MIDNPGFSGTILVSSAMTLVNTTQSVGLRISSSGTPWSVVSYDSSADGANGDGNSLQKSGSNWISATPTPGAENETSSNPPPNPSPDISNTGGGTVDESVDAPKKKIVLKPIVTKLAVNTKAVAGIPTSFSQATTGHLGEPLVLGQWSWTFGDGIARDIGKKRILSLLTQ